LTIQPIFISYYTKNTGYEEESKRLESSLKKFNLQYDVQPIDSKGSWFENCFYRVIFVKDMLEKYKSAVIWVDCDAIIQAQPDLFNTLDEYDFACYFKPTRGESKELLGGTMFFNFTDNALKLLAAWKNRVRYCEVRTRLDQWYLHHAIADVLGIRVYELPATYCQIFDSMKDVGTPVIEHFQASRRLKNVK
jgi:hypothetical protein